MHPNPIYHDADRAQNLDFARTRAFGVLAVSTAEAPLISHVHLTGRLEQRPQDELLDLLDRQSAFYEARLLPKPPWHSDKMEPEALERMMRMIVPVRLSIETVEGTWKLNQNKPETARTAVADQITTGFGAELDDLARMMRS